MLRPTVVGIDVGGQRKGFHAVALQDGTFVSKITSTAHDIIVTWCLDHKAKVVAVDAPCRWSQGGSSRLAEQELKMLGKKMHCYATPIRARALVSDFYKWVFNGEELYRQLVAQYPLFEGQWTERQMSIETFPHAVVCAMAGQVVSAKPKATVRRKALQQRGYDVSTLSNVDFVDAALCAVAAYEFRNNNYQLYGNSHEGFIVVPASQHRVPVNLLPHAVTMR